ncbi:conjugative transfer relaxase/helicase TraI [Vibrio mediterranei]
MLSLSPVIKGSSSDVANYYLKEEANLSLSDTQITLGASANYYVSEREQGQHQQWFGSLARQSGLDGQALDADTFQAALEGNIGDERVFGSDAKHRRQGYDLTFSAPKGASMMALTYGDTRVLEAWEASVKVGLTTIEQETAQIRHYDKTEKTSTYDNTQNLLFGLIRHQTSRNNDCQLHYHAIMMNMTRTNDGELHNLATAWRQRSNELNGTFERIMENRKYYGAIVHSEFALRLQALGYDVKPSEHGMVDIAGIPQEVLDVNSSRRQDILAHGEETGMTSPAARAVAALATRPPKDFSLSDDSLNQLWRERDQEHGFDGVAFVQAALEKSGDSPQPSTEPQTANAVEPAAPSNLAPNHEGDVAPLQHSEPRHGHEPASEYAHQQALSLAAEQLINRRTQFTMQTLITTALDDYANGQLLTVPQLKSAIDQAVQTGALIPTDDKRAQFTTLTAVKQEQALIDATQTRTHGLSQTIKPATLEKLALSTDHQATLQSIVGSKQTVNVVNLRSAPHQISEALLHVGEHSGLDVHFLTPDRFTQKQNQHHVKRQSHTAMQWLKTLVKGKTVPAMTVSRYLSHDHYQADPNTPSLLIVPHAQRLSVQQTTELIDSAHATHSKLVLLNLEGGSEGMGTGAMRLLKKGHATQLAWHHSEQTQTHVHLKETDSPLTDMARDYAALSSSQQRQTHLAAHSKKDVAQLNLDTRHALMSQGQLGIKQWEVDTLEPVMLSKAQREKAHYYERGLLVTKVGIGKQAGQILEQSVVESFDKRSNRVTLKDKDGNTLTVSASTLKHHDLARPTTLVIAQGERLRALGNSESLGLTAFDTVTVTKLSNRRITLTDDHGQSQTFKMAALNHAPITYGYASLIQHTPAGHTHTMISQPHFAASKETLTDQLSLQPEHLTYYTTDANKIEKRLSQTHVQPASLSRVLAATGQLDKYINHTTPQQLSHDTEAALTALLGSVNTSAVEKATTYAMTHLSESDVTMTHQHLVKTALEYALTSLGEPISPDGVLAELDTLKEKGLLLSAEYSDGTRWVTKESLETEQVILSHIEQGKGAMVPLLTPEQTQTLTQTRLSQGQQDAIRLITTTSDRFVAIQGFAGTGKSTMLEQGIELVHQASHLTQETAFIGLAPTHAAVGELQEKGVNAQTLQSVLADFTKHGVNPDHHNAVFLLDESSMTSNALTNTFVQMVTQTPGARAVFLGDMAQLQSISSGKPFQLAIERGLIDVAVMKDIHRQQSEALLSAVHQAIDQAPVATVKHVKQQPALDASHYRAEPPSLYTGPAERIHRTEAITTTSQPLVDAAAEYLSRTADVRDKTLLIAYTNQERDILTTLIRPQLQEYGELDTQEVNIPRLRSLGTGQSDMARISSYKTGDVLTQMTTHYAITEVDTQNQSVTLLDTDTGETKVFLPQYEDHRFNQLWTQDNLPLAAGDKVMWRHTDKELGLKGGTLLTVSEVNDTHVTFTEKSTLHSHTLDHRLLKHAHWDYDYVRTSNLAQGATMDYLIVVVDPSQPLTDFRRAYVDLSRASQHARIFTHSEASMVQTWLTANNDKTSALDTLEHVTPTTEKHFQPDHLTNPAFQENGQFKLSLYGKHLHQQLTPYTESLAKQLLGRVNQRHSNDDTLAFGRGAQQLKVTLTGEYRGYFRNFQTGERGSLINLIMATERLSFPDAVEKAQDYLAHPDKHDLVAVPNNSERLQAIPQKVQQLTEMAHSYYDQSQPIAGTLAERYLSVANANTNAINHHANLRFHPAVYSSEDQQSHPAMIAKIENQYGHFKGIEISYLTHDGNSDHTLNVSHRVLGQKTGNAIAIQIHPNPRATIISANTYTGIELAAKHPDVNILSVNTNNDIRNIPHGALTSPIIVALNQREDRPSPSLINELNQKLGDDVVIIPPTPETPDAIHQLSQTIKENMDTLMPERNNNDLPTTLPLFKDDESKALVGPQDNIESESSLPSIDIDNKEEKAHLHKEQHDALNESYKPERDIIQDMEDKEHRFAAKPKETEETHHSLPENDADTPPPLDYDIGDDFEL